MSTFYEEKNLDDGKLYFRTTPGGAFQLKPAPIDALLKLIQNKLNPHGSRWANAVMQEVGLDPSTVTRIRHNQAILSPAAVLKIHDATGFSVSLIRRVSETRTTAYWNKRYHGSETEMQGNSGQLQAPSEAWR